MGQTRPLFGLISYFSQCKDKYSTNFTINDKSIDEVLGSRTRAAWWKAQTNPLSYGGTPVVNLLAQTMFGTNQVFEWGKYKVNCTPNSHASQKQGYL